MILDNMYSRQRSHCDNTGSQDELKILRNVSVT